MNRQWVFLVVIVLLIGNVVWRIYSHWGLITIHANGQPISEVVRSIERQGGIILRTDFAPNTPVTMNVTRVTLPEALETLATVTDSRWRLTYVVAPNKNEITSAIGNFVAGQPTENWKTAYVRLVPIGDAPLMPPDPRVDVWTVQPPAEKNLQAYLEEGAKNVSAAFLYPSEWNPPVSSDVQSGPIRKVMPKLAKLAHGEMQEVFFLMKPRQRDPALAATEETSRDWMGGGEAIIARMQAEIAKMPPNQRADAQEQIQFVQSLSGLSREERRAKLEDYLQQPQIQDRIEQRLLDRESRMTPQQKLQRAERYAQRRQQIKNGANQ